MSPSSAACDGRLGVAGPTLAFDRRVSDRLLDDVADGWLRPLIDWRDSDRSVFDLQLRRDQRGKTRSWVTLYAGLSGTVNVDERGGMYRVRSAPAYQDITSFDPSWNTWQPADSLAEQWPDLDDFIDAVMASSIITRYVRREGAVHAAVCSGASAEYAVIQREASPSFVSTAAREAVCAPVQAAAGDAMAATGRSDPWWPGVRDHGHLPSMGTSADVLAVDPDGRLLVIEAKPPDATAGIAWAPAQVRLYAELFHHLLATETSAAQHLRTMLAQRQRLGLVSAAPRLTDAPPIVPVVAIGVGRRSPSVLPRLIAIQAALDEHAPAPHLAAPEVWFLAGDGTIEERIAS